MESKGLKVLIHASSFFAPYLVPFVIYLVTDEHEVKKTAVQAILFQLVIGVLIFISALLILVIIGIPLLIGVGIMWLVVPFIAIVKTLNDEDYNYPIVGSWYQ